MPKQKFREIVFQLIYSLDFNELEDSNQLFSILDKCHVSKKNMLAARERADQLKVHQIEIDELIAKFSPEYDFSRISEVEKNILRLGTFEMMYDTAIPPKVAITEAVRLSRKYGSPEGGNFVNAILDALLHQGT
ncbi:MAG: transcription antitermination factor NusB [Simkaniaceae bacterium]|nr:transcription antitermination factor NusB [Simkaniaceae bacterium]